MQPEKFKFEFVANGHSKPLKKGKFLVLDADDHLLIRAQQVEYHMDIDITSGERAREVVGAGIFFPDPLITGWRSEGFGVDTPMHLWDSIRAVFIANAADIAKGWK